MRYYNIIITNPANNNTIVRPASLQAANLPATWCSTLDGTPTGTPLSGAQNIELDIPVSIYSSPAGQAFLRIWGISLAEISQAFDLVGMNIAVYGGMGRGLPLANPAQAGCLVQGFIYQSLGNWQGTDQTLDLYIIPPIIGADNNATPPNLSLNWPANTPLAQAIDTMLATAFPAMKRSINISPALMQATPEVHIAPSLQSMARWITQRTQPILGGNYLGVEMTTKGNRIFVFDNGLAPPASVTPKVIAFQDLIGQPSWIEPRTVQFKTVMRADIGVGDFVQFDDQIQKAPLIATVAPASGFGTVLLKSRPTFRGQFQVNVMHHFGNFRAPTGDDWVTVFNAVGPLPQ